MDRFDDHVRCRRQESVDEMRAGDWLGLRPSVALELGPDAGEGEERPVVVEREPDDVFLSGLRVWLWSVLREAVGGDQTSVLRLQPASPVRRWGVPGVGDRRPAGVVRRGAAPGA